LEVCALPDFDLSGNRPSRNTEIGENSGAGKGVRPDNDEVPNFWDHIISKSAKRRTTRRGESNHKLHTNKCWCIVKALGEIIDESRKGKEGQVNQHYTKGKDFTQQKNRENKKGLDLTDGLGNYAKQMTTT